MSLLFAANGDLVDHPSGVYNIHDGTNSAGTLFLLLRINSDVERQSICCHLGGGGSAGEYGINFRGDQANDPIDGFRQRATVYNAAAANSGSFAAYALNTWLYLAYQWTTSGTSTDQKLLMGSRTLPMAAPSAYTSQSAGSGTVGSGNGAFRAGNGSVTTREFRGDIAYITIIPAVLTLEQLIRLQYSLKPPTGNLLSCHYGFPGTSSIDLSGNANHGAVTGATASEHAPIRSPYSMTSGWRGTTAGAGGGGSPYTMTADAGSYALTGTAASLERGYLLTAAAGSYALTGNDASLEQGYRLVADAGSYALTGNDVQFGRTVAANIGSYTLTGNAAALTKQWRLVADAGSYALTGNDVNLLKGKTITGEAGSYALTGNAAALTKQWRLVADTGSYVLTGNDAALSEAGAFVMIAEQGSYALTGNAAALLRSRIMAADAGSYALTGNAVNLLKGKTMIADAGAYALTGNAAAFLRTRIMPAATGSYVLTGTDVTLIESSAVIEPVDVVARDFTLSTVRNRTFNFINARDFTR